jgi:hypothetical protein
VVNEEFLENALVQAVCLPSTSLSQLFNQQQSVTASAPPPEKLTNTANMVNFDVEGHVRLAELERSVREAGDDVKERYEKLGRIHQRFFRLRGCVRTSVFTGFTLQQNLTMLGDMRDLSPLHEACRDVVVLQRKNRCFQKKIDPAVARAKVLLEEYLELKR